MKKIVATANESFNIIPGSKLDILKQTVFQFGLKPVVELKKLLMNEQTALDMLGPAMKQRVEKPIPEKYKNHPHKQLFYLTFIQLEPLFIQKEPLLDINDTKMRFKESEDSHILNDLSFFCLYHEEKIGQVFTYVAFQIQCLNLFKDVINYDDDFLKDLFLAPLMLLNQQTLIPQQSHVLNSELQSLHLTLSP